MATPYYWAESGNIVGGLSAFNPSVGIPTNTVLLFQADNAGDRLERTICDAQFVIMAEDNTTTHIPFGVSTQTTVGLVVWADVTGTVPSSSVPLPWQRPLDRAPLWTGNLVRTTVFETNGTRAGWTSTYRPEDQIDVAAIRAWTGPGVISVWANFEAVPNTLWSPGGASTNYGLTVAAKGLFKLA